MSSPFIENLQSKLASGLRDLVRNKVAWCDGEALYSVAADSEAESQSAEPFQGKPEVVILARSCYREHTESFPIKAKSELQKILQQRSSAADAVQLWFIGPYENNQRQVTGIQLKSSALPLLTQLISQARVVIPETRLLASAPSKTLNQQTLLEAKSPGQTVYYYQKAAALKGGVVNSQANARMALGVSSSATVKSWRWQDYRKHIPGLLKAYPAADWLTGYKKLSGSGRQIPYKEIAIAGIGTLCLYALLSTVYLSWMNSYRAGKIESASAEVSSFLDQRSETEREERLLESLTQAMQDRDSFYNTLDIISFLLNEDGQIINVRGDFVQVDFRASSNDATAFVQRLNVLPQVNELDFTSPVRRTRGMENFAIQVQLALGVQVAAEESALVPVVNDSGSTESEENGAEETDGED